MSVVLNLNNELKLNSEIKKNCKSLTKCKILTDPMVTTKNILLFFRFVTTMCSMEVGIFKHDCFPRTDVYDPIRKYF